MSQSKTPCLLDIIKIDGRWGQFWGNRVVRFLDNLELLEINWKHYELVKSHNSTSVDNLITEFKEEFSPKELENIHWGPEEKKYLKLKLEVSVFGEYTRKSED